ncbi:hypothetical protein LTR86_000902 [Recurvomyces mirabilis]|nr:hypothetical protein LTR86_000902 [Recurvomyces mirabilis]
MLTFVLASNLVVLSQITVVEAILKPLSIAPSQLWDGNDGRWSTFQIQVGTPGQPVRLLPGTSASACSTTWVVIPQGCAQNPTLIDCEDDRGYYFTSNTSSSWSTQRLANGGLFQLSTYEESMLGLGGNAYYGFDVLGLGPPRSGLPSVSSTLIAGLASNDFWIGSLGLSPLPFNFTDLNDPIPSMLSTLRNQSLIPSCSWAYTAGASYKEPPVFGSLTLGGFDTRKFVPNHDDLTFSFGSDISRDLLVGLTAITYDTTGSSPLLAQKIDIFIDSMVSELWLPLSACEAFASAFKLVWNDTIQYYLVDENVHDALLAQNPVFTFSLAQSGAEDANSTASIRLPYSAFDLNLTQPMFNTPTRYFPLKRAQNATQHTLGRTFLQEAYVIADYERGNFSVRQAAFSATSVAQDLVAILSPIDESTRLAEKDSHLAPGVLAGIAVAAVFVVSLAILGRLWLAKRQSERSSRSRVCGEESGNKIPVEMPQDHAVVGATEADGDAAVYELDRDQAIKPELQTGAGHAGRHELEQQRHVNEIDGTEGLAVELEAV